MLDWPRSLKPRVIECLSQMADMVEMGARRGQWVPRQEARLDSEALQHFLSPEECVLMDSALEGEDRLRQLNIKRLTDGRDLSRHFEDLSGDVETRIRHKAIAVRIGGGLPASNLLGTFPEPSSNPAGTFLEPSWTSL